jgi:hypothetical protein
MLLYLLSQLYPATLPHGRPSPRPNLEAPCPSAHRNAPPFPATTHRSLFSVHHPVSFAPFCFHIVTNPSSRNSFLFTSIRIARGVGLTLRGPFVQSRNSRASYHIPATLAVSCSYTLFCATAHGYLPYSQQLPHSFYCHGGGTPLHGQIPQRLLQPRPQLPGSCGQTIRRVSGLQYTLRPGNSQLRAFKRTPWTNA